MIIGLDWRFADVSGVGRYMEGMLGAAVPSLGRYRFGLITSAGQRRPTIVSANTFCIADAPPRYTLREQIVVPRLLRRMGVSWLFSPHFLTPLRAGCPTVITVHDVAYMRDRSDLPNPAALLYYRAMFTLCIRRATLIVTSSAFSKAELIDVMGAPADRIVVIPGAPGANMRPATKSDVSRVRAQLGLPEDYFVYLGIKRHRKNLLRAIEGLAIARARSNRDLHLVIAGYPDAAWYERLTQAADRHGVGNAVKLLGFIDDEHVPALYTAALGLVYVSLYEGFGLPILEAMACGTPVITSSVTAMIETAGAAALLVEPTDPEAIADGMCTLAHRDAARATLVDRGFGRAAEFSWDRSARRFGDVCDQMGHRLTTGCP